MLIKMTNSVLKARGSPYLKTKSSKEVAIVFTFPLIFRFHMAALG